MDVGSIQRELANELLLASITYVVAALVLGNHNEPKNVVAH